MMPYEWLCEAEPCKRLRTDRHGQALNPAAMRLGPVDPGAGRRFHAECWPEEHSAEPVTVAEAGIGSGGVIVCAICHVPTRTAGPYAVHTSPRSRWCGDDCPVHGRRCGSCLHAPHWRECRAAGCYCRHRGPGGSVPMA